MRPAFADSGNITAGNASQISDGGSAVIVVSKDFCDRHELTPLAECISYGQVAGPDTSLLTQPSRAILNALEEAGIALEDIDLFEINEAFAVVTMAAIQELNLDSSIVNIHGGACALGHPIGASGARIIVTLLTSLQKYDLKKGVASLCIGGGEATAIAVERMN